MSVTKYELLGALLCRERLLDASILFPPLASIGPIEGKGKSVHRRSADDTDEAERSKGHDVREESDRFWYARLAAAPQIGDEKGPNDNLEDDDADDEHCDRFWCVADRPEIERDGNVDEILPYDRNDSDGE